MSNKFFMKRRIISVMSLLRRIFFLKGFLEYEILKKAVSVRRCMDSSYLFTPLGASLTQVTRNVIMTSLVSKACQKMEAISRKEQQFVKYLNICAATRWINL